MIDHKIPLIRCEYCKYTFLSEEELPQHQIYLKYRYYPLPKYSVLSIKLPNIILIMVDPLFVKYIYNKDMIHNLSVMFQQLNYQRSRLLWLFPFCSNIFTMWM